MAFRTAPSRPPAVNFAGRKIVVTGASRGIGAEIAAGLVERGARVVGIARSRFEADRVVPIACDLNEPGAIGELARQIAFDHPDCSGLINNAAIMRHTDLTRGEHAEDIEAEIRINLTAPIQLSVALLPLIARNGPGFVNFVTSGLAIAPRAEAATYCATKAGLRSFARSFRNQCEDAGLRVRVSETVMTLVETSLSRDLPNRMCPKAAAGELLAGIEAGLPEIWIERTRMLRRVHRLSPGLAHRLLRGPNVREMHPDPA